MYSKIFNPNSNRWVNIKSKIGKDILKKYLLLNKGGLNHKWYQKMSYSLYNKAKYIYPKRITKEWVNSKNSEDTSLADKKLKEKLKKEGLDNQHCAYCGLPVLSSKLGNVNGYIVHIDGCHELMKTCVKCKKGSTKCKSDKPYLTKLPGNNANKNMPNNYENFCCMSDPIHVSDIISKYVIAKRAFRKYRTTELPIPLIMSNIKPKTKVYSLIDKTFDNNYNIKVGSEGTVVGISDIDGAHPKYNEMVLIEWKASLPNKGRKTKKIMMYCHMKDFTSEPLANPSYNNSKSSYKIYIDKLNANIDKISTKKKKKKKKKKKTNKKPKYWPKSEKWPPIDGGVRSTTESIPPVFLLKSGRIVQGEIESVTNTKTNSEKEKGIFEEMFSDAFGNRS